MKVDPALARIERIELASVGGLDVDFALELSPGVTVLVGKNGSGKSLIVSSICDGLRGASFRFPDGISRLRAHVVLPNGPRYYYQYELEVRDEPLGAHLQPGKPRHRIVTERCWTDAEEVWHIHDGKMRMGGEELNVPKGEGFLQDTAAWEHPVGKVLLRKFWSTRFVRPGVLRSVEARGLRVIFGTTTDSGTTWDSGRDRQNNLYVDLATILSEKDDEEEELHTNLRKLQVKGRLQLHTLNIKEDGGQVGATLTLGGEHLGYLSDGTLRMLEIVVALIRYPLAPVIIEEPETGIHPGLLDRLLALFEGYAVDRQIILTTHSPYVVNRFEPAAIRIVERSGNRTSARSLGPEEFEHLEAYLRDEGELDQYLFQLDVDDGEGGENGEEY